MARSAEALPRIAPATTDGPSETAILESISAGEKWGADALYDLLYPHIAASIQRVLGARERDYEDLVQTSFERVVQLLLRGNRGEIMSLRAWASGVAAHVALDALRRRVRERGIFDQGLEGAGVAAAGSDSSRQLEAREQLRVVEDVLARMSPELAEAVVLHDLTGHDLSEVATLTKATLPAVQSRVFRGRKELIRRVEKRLGRRTA